MKILVISNGLGEDLIGQRLAQQLHCKNVKIDAAPLVGKGSAYKFNKIFESNVFPSGGFLRKAKDIFRDIFGGLLIHLYHQYQTLKTYRNHYDKIIVVGDVFCLVFASLALQQKAFFLPTAKSHHFCKHSCLEKWIMKHKSICCYPRDILTQKELSKKITAKYLGNPMMDSFERSHYDYPLDKHLPTIGLLPGSREEWVKNLESMLPIVLKIKKAKPDCQFLLSLHPDSKLENLDLKQSDWKYVNNLGLQHPSVTIYNSKCFGDFLDQSWLAIGLAGTANEQAHFHKIPIVAYPGHGAQSSSKRFMEQKKLLGSQDFFFIDQYDVSKISQLCFNNLSPKKAVLKENASAALAIAIDILEHR